MNLSSPLRSIKGVGEKTEQLFNKLGVFTVGDLLLAFPRAYQQMPELVLPSEELVGVPVAIFGKLKTPPLVKHGRNMDVVLATVFTEACPIECVWFRTAFVAHQLMVGLPTIFIGTLKLDGKKLKLEQPLILEPGKYKALKSSLQPVYSLTRGLNNNAIKKVTRQVIDELLIEDKLVDLTDESQECLPVDIVQREGFVSHASALNMVHFPEDFDALSEGRRRLVYEEFFYFILHARLSESQSGAQPNPWSLPGEQHVVDEAIKKLPFELTAGQANTLAQIRADLRGEWLSQRLIQGDVGSGKTIVAFLAMLDVVASGHQAAIMAPTEVLARQHEESFKKLILELGLPYQVVCITGSMSAKERREAYGKAAKETSLFLVGTHALIQEKVEYKDLALVITDEQHRFGVRQRETLAAKGMSPHMLVMSATPIPRTLAMILYGNMQISAIKEMPANRLPIKTAVVKEQWRAKSYKMIAEQVAAGHQAYIICPLVEASETTEAASVAEYSEKLKDIFPDNIRIGSLHGRMAAKDKNQIMEDFAGQKIDVLVSTTVVEVGINNPNATVILIENANRFGLAQLHQLRGRVGRGKHQSYCILMDSSNKNETNERLQVMFESNDGFFIAQEDLRLRGPGDFFGIRQSGELNFRLADIIGDSDILRQAAEDVDEFIKADCLARYPKIQSRLRDFEHENLYVL